MPTPSCCRRRIGRRPAPSSRSSANSASMSCRRSRRSSGMRCGVAASTTRFRDTVACSGISDTCRAMLRSGRDTMQANRFRQRSNWGRVLVVALALAGCRASAGGAAEPIEIKAGIADPVNTVLAWWTAQAAGFYADQGLKVEILNMSGGSRGAQGLQAGRLDVMHVGLSSVVKLNRAGGDLRLIGSLSNVIRFTFFSGPGVTTAADLKGGVVGVSTFGSEGDLTVKLCRRRLR